VTTPYLGEIRMGGWNYAPAGWAFCNGAVLEIDQNGALYNLIGTTYGGDGVAVFALPNLQGRVPVHMGPGFPIAQAGGAENVTLDSTTIPAHSHTFSGSSNPGAQKDPAGNVPATVVAGSAYNANPPTAALAANSIGSAGNSQPHYNMQPFLCVSFIIALQGIYPSQ
jgi:microcystin-dependent protein